MYQQGSLIPSVSPKSNLAAAAESESAKQELHTTLLTTALGASHRAVFSHHTTFSAHVYTYTKPV